MDELSLFERIRRDDDAAFDTVFRTWYPRLVRYADAMLRDRAVAEEIAQEVMLAIWNGRRTLKIDESPTGYLFRATRNRALNELRHRKVEQKSHFRLVPAIEVGPAAEANMADKQIEAALREAVQSLPDRCREVFELSRVQGLRYAEIAATMEISVKTVETQMGKALRILREKMAEWLPE